MIPSKKKEDIWEYGARETGDFLLVNSTHLEQHYGGIG